MRHRPPKEPSRDPKWLCFAVPIVILIAAAGIRLWRISSPPQTIWDEHYYVFDAQAYLGGWIGDPIGSPPKVRIADESTWVHPPLGKWMIALLGVGPFSRDSFGWRFPSALFGVAGVGLLYLLALELWGSVRWAGLAASLLALDGLHIVQSRIGMLDIFLTTFVTAGMLFLVRDRRRMGAGPTERRNRLDNRLFGSPSRFWAGVMFGAAAATKWTGFFALALAALLSTVWILMGRERADRSIPASLGTVFASFAAVPLLVYLASYATFFWQHGLDVRGFLTLQLAMLRYQQTHLKVQPENSLPWTWPLLLHPIRYFGLDSGGSVRRIVALGNPALWWGFLACLPVAIVAAVRRPSWRDAAVFGGYIAMYLPWLYIGRSQFMFYMTPAVPFMCLGVCAALRKLPCRIGRPVAIAFGAAILVAAVAYMPVWTGGWVSRGWAEHLRLLRGWPL